MTRCGVLWVAGLWLCLAPPLVAQDGAAIYEQGAEIIAHLGRIDGPRLRPALVTCAGCHGAEGGGGVEWRQDRAPPIRWPVLAHPTDERPAYDETSFARLLRDGVTASGRPIAAAMPRFEASPQQVAALIGHLELLGRTETQGLTAETIAVRLPQDAEARRGAEAALAAFNAGGGAYGRRLVVAEPAFLDLDAALDLLLPRLSQAEDERLAALLRDEPTFQEVGALSPAPAAPILTPRAGAAFDEAAARPLVPAGHPAADSEIGGEKEGGAVSGEVKQQGPALRTTEPRATELPATERWGQGREALALNTIEPRATQPEGAGSLGAGPLDTRTLEARTPGGERLGSGPLDAGTPGTEMPGAELKDAVPPDTGPKGAGTPGAGPKAAAGLQGAGLQGVAGLQGEGAKDAEPQGAEPPGAPAPTMSDGQPDAEPQGAERQGALPKRTDLQDATLLRARLPETKLRATELNAARLKTGGPQLTAIEVIERDAGQREASEREAGEREAMKPQATEPKGVEPTETTPQTLDVQGGLADDMTLREAGQGANTPPAPELQISGLRVAGRLDRIAPLLTDLLARPGAEVAVIGPDAQSVSWVLEAGASGQSAHSYAASAAVLRQLWDLGRTPLRSRLQANIAAIDATDAVQLYRQRAGQAEMTISTAAR